MSIVVLNTFEQNSPNNKLLVFTIVRPNQLNLVDSILALLSEVWIVDLFILDKDLVGRGLSQII